MKRIYVPSREAEDWRPLLAEPGKHWRKGRSARTLASSWEDAKGFPPEVKKSLNSTFPDIEPLIIIPEHKVNLPGGGSASQNDIWIMARANSELVSIAVEGKVAEDFGPTVSEWQISASPGKKRRLQFIQEKLNLPEIPGNLRYQLLHRTVSAIIEAENFNTRQAVMLIHSFSPIQEHFDDYRIFLNLFSIDAETDRLQSGHLPEGWSLYFAWINGDAKYLDY